MEQAAMSLCVMCAMSALAGQILGKSRHLPAIRFAMGLEIIHVLLGYASSFMGIGD